MRRGLAALALCAVVASVAAASGTAAQSVSFLDDPDATARWMTARVRAARAGHADVISVPVAFASLGWGCTCPGNYVGFSPDVAGGAWLSLTLERGVTLPTYEPRGGTVMQLEGYLTGNVTRFEGDPGQRYAVYELVVTRVVAPHVSESPRLRVVRASAYACTSAVTDTTPLHVHARAGVGSSVVGDVPVGARVEVRDVRGEWLALSGPRAGWVSAYEVTTTCTPRP